MKVIIWMKIIIAGLKIKVIGIIIVITLAIPGYLCAQSQFKRDSTLYKYSYFKFSIFPFFYANLVQDAVWLTFHYEFQAKPKSKFTCNAVVDYHNWTYKMIVNGVPVSVIPDNIEFYIRPQIRFYPGKQTFKGFYLGLFPLYLYRDLTSYQKKGSYWGAGAIGGYQFFVRKKIPLEINCWVSGQTGVIDKVDPYGNPNPGRDSFGTGSFELNIGWPIKRPR